MGAVMTDTSKLLADIICNALVEAEIVNGSSIVSLKQQILSGKTKSENWSIAIEKSICSASVGDENGE
jgi:hypothetical protein